MEPTYEILCWIVKRNGPEPNPRSLNISRDEFNKIVYDLKDQNFIRPIGKQSAVIKKNDKKENTYRGGIWLFNYEATIKGTSFF